METAGLFDAKTHRSGLVAGAKRGEDVIIRRHNNPVARFVPVGPQAGAMKADGDRS
jgi:antitoxin (DNA-binding transcriptional repressor) of toxin-antitoxin stability system